MFLYKIDDNNKLNEIKKVMFQILATGEMAIMKYKLVMMRILSIYLV